jgi:hypothetical protein
MDGGHNRTRDFRSCLLLHSIPPPPACVHQQKPMSPAKVIVYYEECTFSWYNNWCALIRQKV